MTSSTITTNTKKKTKRGRKRRKPSKVFLRDLETQMGCKHEQQPQTAWETVANGV